MKKPLIFVAILAAALLGGALLRDRLPDMGMFRTWLDAAQGWRSAQPLLASGLFLLAYVGATALSLPLAIWLTLAAGALFGFWWGLVLASFGASLGATLAFLAARFFLRDTVQARFGSRLAAVNRGIERDGPFYLFTLRLIPVVPFFLVNLLMGLTPIRTRVFYGVSQVAMLPAAAVYVNAGTQIGRLQGPGDILSPGVLLSFAALGAFPWVTRWVVSAVQGRRVHARWTRPARFDRNLVVIGAGSAGLVSAYIAAAVRAKVTLVEAGRMGGDCLNTGCVPSKALIRSAKLAHQMRRADRFGLAPAAPQVPFRAVMARVQRVIAGIEPHDSIERYTALGVEVLTGRGVIRDPWTVEVALASGGTRRLTTRAIVIAAGATPVLPPLDGLATVAPLTSDTLWQALSDRDAPPARLVILGGGPIGCELAQAFQRLGSQVTLIEMAPRLLLREDEDAARIVADSLRDDGVTVLTGHRALRACTAVGCNCIESEGSDAVRRIAFDEIIVAVGRAARLEGYGLEDLGIPTGRVIETNDYLETIYPSIYAAGDVAGPYQLTHAGAHQAWFATVNALFGTFRRFRADYRVIPAATFTDPEVARVGLSETEARAQGVAFEVTRYDIGDLDRAIADGTARGFVKVLTPPGRDRILGVTIVGEHAGDLLAEFVLAMKHGLGLNRILSTIHIYPTLSEANKFAAGEWRKAHVNPRLLGLLERFHRWQRGRG